MSQVLNWKVAILLSLIFASIVMIEARNNVSRSPQNEMPSRIIMREMGMTAGQ